MITKKEKDINQLFTLDKLQGYKKNACIFKGKIIQSKNRMKDQEENM